jgi:hypothetical protein
MAHWSDAGYNCGSSSYLRVNFVSLYLKVNTNTNF